MIKFDELKATEKYRMDFSGFFSTKSAAETATLRFKINGSEILSVNIPPKNVTEAMYDGEVKFTVISEGVSGELAILMKVQLAGENDSDGTVTNETIDTTQVNEMTLTMQWGVADPGNSLTINQADLRPANKQQ